MERRALSRIVGILLGVVLAQSCAHATPRQAKEIMTDDKGYAFGAVGCGELQLGVKVAAGTSRTAPIAYRIAIANRGSESKKLTIFAALDERYRALAILRAGDKEVKRPAIEPRVPASGNYAMTITLAPGEIHEREGSPIAIDDALSGKMSLELAFGGVKAHPCELRSAKVELAR